jgi:hypothetical protein
MRGLRLKDGLIAAAKADFTSLTAVEAGPFGWIAVSVLGALAMLLCLSRTSFGREISRNPELLRADTTGRGRSRWRVR